jgi:hypothetical protein
MEPSGDKIKTMRSDAQMYNQEPLRRPFRVTILAVGVLSIAGFNLLRLIQTLRQWKFLVDLPGFSPVYVATTGFIWFVVGLPLFWGLWRGHAWAARFTPGFAAVYALYYWLDHLLVANRAVALVNWPCAAVLTILLMAFVLWVLTRRKSQDFFKHLA